MKYILSLVIAMTISIIAFGQNVPQYKIFNLDTVDQTLTTNKAIFKQREYPVYISKKGRLYIILGSKTTGKLYRKYI